MSYIEQVIFMGPFRWVPSSFVLVQLINSVIISIKLI